MNCDLGGLSLTGAAGVFLLLALAARVALLRSEGAH